MQTANIRLKILFHWFHIISIFHNPTLLKQLCHSGLSCLIKKWSQSKDPGLSVVQPYFHQQSKPSLLPSLDSGFPGGSEVKASACNVGDLGSIPGSGRSPGEGNGNPLQYFAWRTPWTEEPGRLQSTGSQRVGHD